MISGLRLGVRMTETVTIVANNKLATPTPIRAGFVRSGPPCGVRSIKINIQIPMMIASGSIKFCEDRSGLVFRWRGTIGFVFRELLLSAAEQAYEFSDLLCQSLRISLFYRLFADLIPMPSLFVIHAL